jgi:hypothetical protein
MVSKNNATTGKGQTKKLKLKRQTIRDLSILRPGLARLVRRLLP